jgi:hypothetical protein
MHIGAGASYGFPYCVIADPRRRRRALPPARERVDLCRKYQTLGRGLTRPAARPTQSPPHPLPCGPSVCTNNGGFVTSVESQFARARRTLGGTTRQQARSSRRFRPRSSAPEDQSARRSAQLLSESRALPTAAQDRSTSRNLFGVMPIRRTNTAVKWLCVSPTALAICPIDHLGSCKRARARQTRCSVTYRCGGRPVACLNPLAKWNRLMPAASAISCRDIRLARLARTNSWARCSLLGAIA